MRRGTLILSIILIVASWYFWHSPFLYPIRIFVVFLHEIGHGLMAVATGGKLLRIELLTAEGGVTYTQGGNRFLILNAGYLGSLLFGVGILANSRSLRTSGPTLAFIALTTAVMTALFLRPILGFSFFYGVMASIVLTLVALKAPLEAQQFLLRFLGVFSCLYALFDIRDDVLRFSRMGGRSDATMLAELTYIPAVVWGAGWILLSLLILFTLRRKLFG